MSRPLEIEVIAYAPTAYYHCTHCEVAWQEVGATRNLHREQLESSLPTDLLQEYRALAEWVQETLRRYCDQVAIKVIDAASVEGVWKALRYGTRRYPAVIINGQARFSGAGALNAAQDEIARRLGQPAVA